MEGRRLRRFVRRTRTPLPISHANPPQTSNSISCCYCDYKFTAFINPLFNFGQNHSRYLKIWFSIGVGFSLTALVAVTMILLWQLAITLGLFKDSFDLCNLSSTLLFGFSPTITGLSSSLADICYVCFSTLISVSVHELGHVLAASSEGIQMEYFAVFLAILFPGALVAFDHDLLEALPPYAALRIYCAGIWHNAVCCAVSGLVLFLLPVLLFPFFIHGESPMVLHVPSVSPLAGYLYPGDIILSLDGQRINNVQQWMKIIASIDEMARKNSNYLNSSEEYRVVSDNKGYCVPSHVIEESKTIHLVDNELACPNDLSAFVTMPCFGRSISGDGIGEDNTPERKHCLDAQDIVNLKKCGDGWVTDRNSERNCTCSQYESCLSPIQMPGLTWVEIMYLKPYSPECQQVAVKSLSGLNSSDSTESICSGTFVFFGDVIAMAHSLQLTEYQPRWDFLLISHLPHVLENILTSMFHVSLTLALLNSLPIYFLDGESISDVSLRYFTLLRPGKKRRVLQVYLMGGTFISVLSFFRILFSSFL